MPIDNTSNSVSDVIKNIIVIFKAEWENFGQKFLAILGLGKKWVLPDVS